MIRGWPTPVKKNNEKLRTNHVQTDSTAPLTLGGGGGEWDIICTHSRRYTLGVAGQVHYNLTDCDTSSA